MHLSTALLTSLALASSLAAARKPAKARHNAGSHGRRSFEAGPLIADNFPDPSYVEVDGTYYAFSTNSGGHNVPVATSTDFKTWTLTNSDALPSVASWSDGTNVWAPDVSQLADGTFVMYYSATLASNTQFHCFGAATASSPAGPYTPVGSDPIACPTGQGGAIDAAGFEDYDGTRYVVYKIDGNSLYPGGQCGNPDNKQGVTPIMLQQLDASGTSATGSAVEILNNGQYDGPLIEAPSLSRIADSSSAGGWLYILFFSSNCYNSQYYDISYAVSTNGVTNGGAAYAKAVAPLIQTGADGNAIYAPGGTDSPTDLGANGNILWHADQGTSSSTRQLWGGSVAVDVGGRTVSI